MVVAMGSAFGPEDIPAMCEQLTLLVRSHGGPVLLIIDASDIRRPDAVTVDALAHLRLTAQREGATLLLRRAGSRLLELLDLMGLRCLLTGGLD
jgi:ABC-type transporter Mla MlaB component